MTRDEYRQQRDQGYAEYLRKMHEAQDKCRRAISAADAVCESSRYSAQLSYNAECDKLDEEYEELLQVIYTEYAKSREPRV